jgi:O-acetyl-ADP-ribose deacetylase (regulator of RNase III)
MAGAVSKTGIRELFYITHIDNLDSILKHGILSHEEIESRKLHYTPIYDAEIVSTRKKRKVPDGRSLWAFANLYFQPRNPMMYRVIAEKSPDNLVVVGVRKSIVGLSDGYITDGNAASQETNFYPMSEFKKLQGRIVKETNKEFWNPVDGSKRKIMAECLVSKYIPPTFIDEIYVANSRVASGLRSKFTRADVHVVRESGTFFQPDRTTMVTPRLSVMDGDMFFSRMQTLTVSVNCVGIMGKGLASRAKYQFPDVYVNYQDACRSKKLALGKPYIYKREGSLDYELADEPQSMANGNSETWFILFPTKDHWRDMSDISSIETGLRWIRNNYKEIGIKSLAVPALGCGLGGLLWKDVGSVMCKYLDIDIPVQIYLPAEKQIPHEQISREFLLRRPN